jgi:hypothetical protein
LDRDLIGVLYYEAKARKLPMTQLASSLIRTALRFERTRLSIKPLRGQKTRFGAWRCRKRSPIKREGAGTDLF